MAVSYVDGAITGGNPTTSLTFTVPAGAALNDLMCLEFTHRGTGDGTVSDNSGDGVSWTRKGEALFASSTFTVQSYYKRVTAAMVGGGDTVTVSGLTNSSAGTLTLYRGVIETGDPFDAWTPEANASGDESHAAISATVADTMVCLVVGNSPDLSVTSPSTTSPGALSIRQEKLSTGGTDASCMHASAAKTGTGSTGALTWSQTNAASGSIAYILKPQPTPTQTAVARISLESGGTPDVDTGHSIKVRARVTSGSGTIRAALYEGANNRSGDLESSALTTSLADYTLSIAEASAANITDYSDLEIRLWGYAAGGGAIVFEVDQLWLEIPEASVSAYSLDCQPASFTVAGAAATIVAGRAVDAAAASYALTGTAATVLPARAILASPATYTVTGTTATVVAARELDAQDAAYSVTGIDAGFGVGFTLSCDPGSYTIDGGSGSAGSLLLEDGTSKLLLEDGSGALLLEPTFVGAILLADRAVLADPATHTVTGSAATVAAGLLFDGQPGAYAVTGTAATVVPGYATLVAPGTYAVAGADADLVYTPVGAYELDAQDGAFAVTGSDAQLLYGALLSIDAQPGAISVTGTAATVAAGIVFNAEPAAYTVTGSDVTPVAARALSADPGSYSVAAEDIATRLDSSVDAQPGVYAVSGAAAGLVVAVPGAYVLDAATGVFAVTGANAATVATREVNAALSAYVVTGLSATVAPVRSLAANAGAYTVTGNDSTVLASRLLAANAGTVAFTGVAASIGSVFDFEVDAATGNVAVAGATANLVFVPGQARLTTRGGRIRWNTTGRFYGETRAGSVAQPGGGSVSGALGRPRAGRITQPKEGAVA